MEYKLHKRGEKQGGDKKLVQRKLTKLYKNRIESISRIIAEDIGARDHIMKVLLSIKLIWLLA